MTLVATLVSNPSAPAVDETVLAAARAALPVPAEATVLAPGVAADLVFAADGAAAADGPAAGGAIRAIEDAVRAALRGRPIDVFVQRAAGRRKRLLVADMDSTLIGQECIDELAAELGLKPKIAAITERAMRGEIAFEPALRERVALLAGLDAGVVETVWRERIREMPGAATLAATMRANGGYAAIVSGGFTVFTERVAAALGFDEHNANELIIEAGRLAGRVTEPILGQDAKRERLHALAARFGLSLSETLAVGDGANDLAMIRDAGLGVAYRAKPAVAAEADARVDHGDLTALLYFQGYRAAEFAGG
ncbi:phosphoserine phosphatase SerB [Pseudoxanthobacter sp. M-2]|uniref:phosphoserine phosphatase SerB n=1 Tax=Pseudoxanthobacter sp. M-2 TaxID=3078754 RepID=UPI0038FC0C36